MIRTRARSKEHDGVWSISSSSFDVVVVARRSTRRLLLVCLQPDRRAEEWENGASGYQLGELLVRRDY